MKKTLSILLMLLMVLSIVPLTVAEEGEVDLTKIDKSDCWANKPAYRPGYENGFFIWQGKCANFIWVDWSGDTKALWKKWRNLKGLSSEDPTIGEVEEVEAEIESSQVVLESDEYTEVTGDEVSVTQDCTNIACAQAIPTCADNSILITNTDDCCPTYKCVKRPKLLYKVKGRITTNGKIIDVGVRRFDGMDVLKFSNNVIKFKGLVGPHFDGLYFRTTGNLALMELWFDGKKETKIINIGKNDRHPANDPFKLKVRPAIKPRKCKTDEVIHGSKCVSSVESESISTSGGETVLIDDGSLSDSDFDSTTVESDNSEEVPIDNEVEEDLAELVEEEPEELDEAEIEEETEDDEVVDTSDELEVESDEFEQEETGDETIEEVEEDVETDEEIEEELEITDEEMEEINEAIDRIGLRAYVLNRMLKCRLRARIAEANAIIYYLAEEDTSELQVITDQLVAIQDSIDPKTMTKEEHQVTIGEIKEFVASFKENAKAMIPEEDIPKVRKLIKNHHDKAIKECSKLLWKAKELHNRKQFRNALREVVKDAKELRKDGKKLLDSAARLKKLHALKNKYEGGELTPDEVEGLKNEWKEGVKNYGLDRAASVVKNERAQLAIVAVKVKRAIVKAKEAGEDTTGLENKLTEVRGDIKSFVPGKILSSEAIAKAKVTRAKLDNLQKDNKIVQRIKAPVKKAVAKRPILKKAIAKREGAATTGDTQ